MLCERPGGPFIQMWRDSKIKFPPNWEGELPPCATPEEQQKNRDDMVSTFKVPEAQLKEVTDFLEEYERRYYEVVGTGAVYHRICGGGAMVETEGGVFCAKCGKLPDLIPPACMR